MGENDLLTEEIAPVTFADTTKYNTKSIPSSTAAASSSTSTSRGRVWPPNARPPATARGNRPAVQADAVFFALDTFSVAFGSGVSHA